jgi:hypothetical protein
LARTFASPCLGHEPKVRVATIRVLGVPFGFSSLFSSFLEVVLDEDVHHVETFPRLGDVEAIFDILSRCFTQRFFYLLCTFPFLFQAFDINLQLLICPLWGLLGGS